jgi:hypothetical protein
VIQPILGFTFIFIHFIKGSCRIINGIIIGVVQGCTSGIIIGVVQGCTNGIIIGLVQGCTNGIIIGVVQGCTNPKSQVEVATKFCMVTLQIC